MRRLKLIWRPALFATICAAQLFGGTVGKVVTVRGHVADIDYDERRGLVYAANFTANRVEVISVGEQRLLAPITVAERPSSVAMSADGRFLVVGHHSGALTVNDLDANLRRTISTPSPVLAVAFGASPRALVVTTTAFYLLEPLSATLLPIALGDSSTGSIPVPPGTFPPEIVRASAGVSGDRQTIYVLTDAGGEDQTYLIRYRPADADLSIAGLVTTPNLGPRVVTVDESGANVMAGWGLLRVEPRMVLMAQLPRTTGQLNIGTAAYDFHRHRIYAQALVAESGDGNGNGNGGGDSEASPVLTQLPLLHIMDSDNLTVREQILLPQWLAGKSVFSPDMTMLFSASDSGVLLLPMEELYRARRVIPSVEDLLFEGNFCDNRAIRHTFELHDPEGRAVDFRISLPAGTNGVRVSPLQGTTPATIVVDVDPTAFQFQQGTAVVKLTITSNQAVNLIPSVRLLINTKDFDQRGKILNVPGRIVDVAADPYRGRFYLLRQDRNEVLVFDAFSLEQTAVLRTGNTPVQMAVSADGRYLIVVNDNSQIANVIDLDVLEPTEPVEFPFGVYGRSIAVTGNAIWATGRDVREGETGKMFNIDLGLRIASDPPRLGIYENNISIDSAVGGSHTGGTAILVQPEGQVMLYEAAAGTWVAGRDDLEELSGGYAALSDDFFLAGNYLLDRALVPFLVLDAEAGTPSGAATIPGQAFLRTAATAAGRGFIERIELGEFPGTRSSKLTEAPPSPAQEIELPVGLIGQTILPFTRTLAVVPSPETIVSISSSGVQILEPNYDAAVAVPQIDVVTNAADFGPGVAPGGLISIRGSELSASTDFAGAAPWPTALGEACVTLNGTALPLGRVSPGEIIAQLLYTAGGTGVLTVRSAGGVSSNYSLPIQVAAPAVFRNGSAGPISDLATVVRHRNLALVSASNPVRPEDTLSIFFTGGGRVLPGLVPGEAGPSDPPSNTVIRPVVMLGTTPLEVTFSGVEPGQVGVYRIDVKVPWKLDQSGWDVPLSIQQAGFSTTLPVRVVPN